MTLAELNAENLKLHRELAQAKLALHQMTLQWESAKGIAKRLMAEREAACAH